MSSPLDELEQRGAWAMERHLPGATLPLSYSSSQVWWLQPAPLHTHFLTDLFTLPVCLLSSQ